MFNAYSDKKLQDKIKEIKQKGQKKTLVDSGGFQLVKEPSLDINPIDVFKMQKECACIGFILDFPLFKRDKQTGAEVPITNEEEIQDYLNATTKNVNQIASLKSSEFDLYSVIHGNNPKQYHMWWSALKGLREYQGISLKTKTEKQLILSFFTVMREGFSKFHALGASSARMVMLYWYLILKYEKMFAKEIELFTYDSRSPQFSIEKKVACSQFTYLLSGTGKILQYDKNDISGCDCLMCEYLQDKYGGKKYQLNQHLGLMTAIHNCNVMHRYNKFIYSFEEVGNFRKFIIKVFNEQIRPWLNVIDEIFLAVDKYPNKEFVFIYYDNLKHVHRRVEML